jgi:ribosome-associated translation inhibitor RaiA
MEVSYMKVELRIVNTAIAEVLRGYVERRLRFALGHLGEGVSPVSVTVSRNAGGEANCRISSHIVPFGEVGVRETDRDLFSAIDRATGKFGRLFGRTLQRAREAKAGRESVRLAA